MYIKRDDLVKEVVKLKAKIVENEKLVKNSHKTLTITPKIENELINFRNKILELEIDVADLSSDIKLWQDRAEARWVGIRKYTSSSIFERIMLAFKNTEALNKYFNIQ